MMAAFYHDSSRKSVFAERTIQRGSLSGPEKCLVDLLEWSPGISVSPHHEREIGNITLTFPVLTCGLGNITPQRLIETNAQALRSRAQPRVQIVYASPSNRLRCC